MLIYEDQPLLEEANASLASVLNANAQVGAIILRDLNDRHGEDDVEP